MFAHGNLLCDSDAEHLEWSNTLNAGQKRRLLDSSLTSTAECHNNFFKFVAVWSQVIGLCPVLYVVELCASRVLVHCWDVDVGMRRTFTGVAAVKSEALTTWSPGQLRSPVQRDLTMRGSGVAVRRAVWVTGEIVVQPVVDSIRNIYLRKRLKQGGMADSVEHLSGV